MSETQHQLIRLNLTEPKHMYAYCTVKRHGTNVSTFTSEIRRSRGSVIESVGCFHISDIRRKLMRENLLTQSFYVQILGRRLKLQNSKGKVQVSRSLKTLLGQSRIISISSR